MENFLRQGSQTLSERIKLSVLSLLLILAVFISAFTIANTFRAVHNLQLQNHDVKVGNVSTIRDWMTVPTISHIYHVPEDYVYHSLAITNPATYHHVTLYDLAHRKHKPVDQVIHTVQRAILNYRKQHHSITIPLWTHHSPQKQRSPVVERAEI